MMSLRTYGKPPFTVAVIHGGPGAAGEMVPVALELSRTWNVLEPLQTATSLEGQVGELRAILAGHGELPVTLIGFSWGAWLGYLVAARYPAIIRNLILIGCGPYAETYVAKLHEVRSGRLHEGERAEYASIIRMLGERKNKDSDAMLARLGALSLKTDAYDPISGESNREDPIGGRADLFQKVWSAAVEMRRSGKLLELGKLIQCPVVAIHGDYDPHPAEGVQKPLSAVLRDFRFVLLRNCGHRPWIERQAKGKFYEILHDELAQ